MIRSKVFYVKLELFILKPPRVDETRQVYTKRKPKLSTNSHFTSNYVCSVIVCCC